VAASRLVPDSPFDSYDLELDRRNKTGSYARPRSAARLAIISLAWAVTGLACQLFGVMLLRLGVTSLFVGAAFDGGLIATVGGFVAGLLLSFIPFSLALVSGFAVPTACVSSLLATRREAGWRRVWPTVVALASPTGLVVLSWLLWTSL
jgi:hypothetical protein